MSKIEIKNVYKIFGDQPSKVLPMVQDGATKEEIMEVYQLVSVLGMHTITMGVPVLIDEMDKAGQGDQVDRNFSERQLAIKEEFIKHRGYWSGFWEDLLALDPDFLEIYQKFSLLLSIERSILIISG